MSVNPIKDALIAKLAGDATLAGLLPDGVFSDVSASGKTRFVIVSQVHHDDAYMFEGSAYEQFVYLVKAVVLGNSGTTVKAAAARIHLLLQDVALTVVGYAHMLTRRSERVRYAEVDSVNKDIRWQHRGGLYEIVVSPS